MMDQRAAAGTQPHPPAWASWLLALVLATRDRESVTGDLIEEYRAARGPLVHPAGRALRVARLPLVGRRPRPEPCRSGRRRCHIAGLFLAARVHQDPAAFASFMEGLDSPLPFMLLIGGSISTLGAAIANVTGRRLSWRNTAA